MNWSRSHNMTRPNIIAYPDQLGLDLYRVSHSLWEDSERRSRPYPIIDRRGEFLLLVPALIALLVYDELGEDHY